MITVIHSNRSTAMLTATGPVLSRQLHMIAEAFIKDAKSNPYRELLRRIFGRWNFRSYCIDHTGPHAVRVMFSTRVKPELVMLRGGPAGISPRDAAAFELYADMAVPFVLTNPSNTEHPFDAGIPR